MSELYTGIPVSSGIVIGTICKIEEMDLTPDKELVSEDYREEEGTKIKKAFQIGKEQLDHLISKSQNAEIFAAHRSMLEDPSLEELLKEHIEEGENAQLALFHSIEEISQQFLAIEDDYLKERVADLQDIYARLMRILKGKEDVDLVLLDQEVVLVARDLAPSQTAMMDAEKVKGFVTQLGGKTGHTAIMARAMEIPAVVGCKGLFERAVSGDIIILDGSTGEIYLNPTNERIQQYRLKEREEEEEKRKLSTMIGEKACTKDGHFVHVLGNVGSIQEVKSALLKGIDGIGLFRSEFIYMDKQDFPTEEEQFEVYKEVGRLMGEKPVVIRTLDIGGDKDLPYGHLKKEENPFLGYRAIRFCLGREDLFKVQLRAILRASAYGNLKIMYPMITSVEELKRAKALLELCKEELKDEKLLFKAEIEVGMMIETPSTVLLAGTFGKYVDFFSIGTNDLTQYILAADRGNEKVHYLYNSFHPAVLKSIYHIINEAHKNNIWVGMCGEFAGDLRAIPLLLGMGLDEFSMSAQRVLRAKESIIKQEHKNCKELVDKVLKMETTEEVEQFLGLLKKS